MYPRKMPGCQDLLDVVQQVVRNSFTWLPKFAWVSRNNSVSHRASSFASCKLLVFYGMDRIRGFGGCELPFLPLFTISSRALRASALTYPFPFPLTFPSSSSFLTIPSSPERQTMSGVVWVELGNVQMRLNVQMQLSPPPCRSSATVTELNGNKRIYPRLRATANHHCETRRTRRDVSSSAYLRFLNFLNCLFDTIIIRYWIFYAL